RTLGGRPAAIGRPLPTPSRSRPMNTEQQGEPMTTSAPPRSSARVHQDGTVEVTHQAGGPARWVAGSLDEARQQLIAHLAGRAEEGGRAVTADVAEPDGEFSIAVDATGNVTTAPPPTPPAPVQAPTPAHAAPAPQEPPATPAVGNAAPPVPRRRPRATVRTPPQPEQPATTGMRGMLTRMGIRTGPSAAERARREDEQAVSQHWPGVRTIAVVNGKGGAGKTPTTALLSAVF